MRQQLWNVAGSLCVDEPLTTRTAGGARLVRRRPLAGVHLRIVGWPDEHACASVWGDARTDHRGHFHARVRRPAWAQLVHLRVRLADASLVVHAGPDAHGRVADAPWLPVRTIAADGPALGTGRLAFGAHAPAPLAEPAAVRAAVAWYVARSTLAYLSAASGTSTDRRDGPLTVAAGDVQDEQDEHDDALRALVRRTARAWLARHPAAVRRWRHATHTAPPTRAARDLATPHLLERVVDAVVASLWPTAARDARATPRASALGA